MHCCLVGCWPRRPPVQARLETGTETWAWGGAGGAAMPVQTERGRLPTQDRASVSQQITPEPHGWRGRSDCVERALHFQPRAPSQAGQRPLPRPILSFPCPWGHLWNPSRQPDILSAYSLGPATTCLPGTWRECTPASRTALAVTSQDMTGSIPAPSS